MTIESERQEFIRAYTRILVANWSDDSYAQRLSSSPRDVLAEAGLRVGSDIDITIVRTPAPATTVETSEAQLDTQVENWFDAEERDELVLYIPDAPVVLATDLTMQQLEGISAGEAVLCCCCPCCCCI